MELEGLRVYQQQMELGEKVWILVRQCDWYTKDTIGKQMVRTVDSVAANLSERFGRYHYRKAIHYSYYSRSSLYEIQTWLTKVRNRKLISEEDFNIFTKEIKDFEVKLNNSLTSPVNINNRMTMNDNRITF